MYKSLSVLFVVLCLATSSSVRAQPKSKTGATSAPAFKFDRSRYAIPYKQFVLPNGLTLLVHEDHSAPVVSVNVWYHVGSRNEKRGRTGFAHLFEHFFFNGSANYPHGFREAMDDLGANNRNGTTNTDRTNFFEDVPVSALERTLYLEADRMGFLTLSKEMLERERGVVQNEKREGENQPLGKAFTELPTKLYPTSHPYSWPVIGSMDDLNAAVLDDVKQWYEGFYGPNNAVLALGGDITPEKAQELVKKFFDGIAPVPPLARLTAWVPQLSTNVRDEMQDRIPETVLLRAYHIPGWKEQDLDYFRLLNGILSGSKSAALNRRLIYEKQVASNVDTWVDDQELSGLLNILVTVKKGIDPAVAEQELDAVLKNIIERGPTAAEMDRAKSRYLANFSRSIERTGGFGGRSDVLAESMTYGASPTAYLDKLERLAEARLADINGAAQKWLTRPHYTLLVKPYPDLSAGKTEVDRSKLPPLGTAPDVAFPKVQKATLANGLKVLLLERTTVPIVNFTLAVDAGFASDVPAKAGAASLALDLLDKGTATKDVFAIADALDAVGAQLNTRSEQDLSFVQLRALAQNLKPSLLLFSDIIRQPAFPESQFAILKDQRLSEIDFEKSDPRSLVMRTLPALLYGKNHPYGMPQTGTGYTASVKSLTRKDLMDWHAQWFTPANSTLIVTGNVSMSTLLPALEAAFSGWHGGAAPAKNIQTVPATAGGKVYLIDKPDATQSVIVAAHVSVPGGQPDDIAIETVLRNFGGMATSRLNRNLRLDKHWSYGTAGFLSAARGQRSMQVVAPVQTDKTKEAMLEVAKELKGVTGERPLAGEEYASIMRNMTLQLPARFSTLQALENAASRMINYKLPDDYWQSYAAAVRGLTAEQLNSAAQKAVHPAEMIWLIVGDLKKVEKGIRELNFGTVVKLDAEGNQLPQ